MPTALAIAGYGQGRVAIPGVTSVSTWGARPQPQAAQPGGSRPAFDDAELAKSTSKKLSKMLPGTQNARKMATQASKKMSASTKGASKMASAFGRKLRLAPTRDAGGQHQAIVDESPGGSQNVIGRQGSDEERLVVDDADVSASWASSCEPDTHWEEHEDTSSLILHAQYSPQSTPSTEHPQSPECPDRSDSDCQGSGRGSDTHSQGTGSDSDAIGRSKCRTPQLSPQRREPVLQRREPETWDAKAFSASKRPLDCQSIWDIPTSRVPKPAPPPVQPAVSMHPGGGRALPKISVTVAAGSPTNDGSRGGGAPFRPKGRDRSAVVVCLSLSLFTAAVVAAMLLLS